MDPSRNPSNCSIRPWLVVDSSGQTHVMEAGKQAIMRRTCLPARDLRLLDPLLSYPSTLLGRERAIVVNLEHIKAIITAHQLFLLNSNDPSLRLFLQQLERRLYQAREGGVNAENTNRTSLRDLLEVSRQRPVGDEERKTDGKQTPETQDGLKLLPFEFIALEACLEAACSCLDNEASTLEQEARPVLDKLTLKISTLNLERVRQIKSRLVTISGRVQKVRDELEQLLEDDKDLAEMCLTDKLVHCLKNSIVSSIDEEVSVEDEVAGSDTVDRNPDDVYAEGDLHNIENQQEHLFRPSVTLGRDNHGNRNSTPHTATSKHLGVEELEMLLEAYFVQIDGTLNKLSTLREYVDDTEDYINIMLDDKQNHLLQMGVLISTATLVVNAFIVVAGVFGMNIAIELFDGLKQKVFLLTIFGSTAGTIFLYVAAISWYKHKRLL
ncbi:magnesium transporter MRS2-3 [Daucus carota subsp. sativus]|uniref:magnesium transporter MRS2-3 n=1 Tax=Daucus carota subsp. sativus TaxID=79200 RepID=UPI0007B2ECC2|nr:PREDICTED: magnesium transporter MRS2-3-like [Daucus carota subsp. sativus]